MKVLSPLDCTPTAICYGSWEEVDGLRDCIRNGASLSQIRYHLRSLGRLTQATCPTTVEATEDTVDKENDQ